MLSEFSFVCLGNIADINADHCVVWTQAAEMQLLSPRKVHKCNLESPSLVFERCIY